MFLSILSLEGGCISAALLEENVDFRLTFGHPLRNITCLETYDTLKDFTIYQFLRGAL